MHNKTINHLARFKDIALILLGFGFDDIVERLEFPGKEFLQKKHLADDSKNVWVRIRLTLEQLGPGFIKIGQILSLRPDLVPQELLLELRKLQDDVPPHPFKEIKVLIEKELGGPIDEIFSYFDTEPLAGASLSQVHRAVLLENRQAVAVKIQRPEIREIIEVDLDILENIANQLRERIEAFSHYNLPGLVQEIRKSLLHEIDFHHEARTMQIVRSNFSEEQAVRIPKVYDDFTTSKLLTMELIVGEHLDSLSDAPAEIRRRLAAAGLRIMIKQIFEDGLFHADPHPGNVLIVDQKIFCLLDWGMVGRLTETNRFLILDLIEAAIDKDSAKLMEIILLLTTNEEDGDLAQLEQNIMEILDVYHSVTLQHINIGKLLLELSNIMRRNRLHLPVNLASMIKAMVTAEGVARQLYPRLNVIEEAEPFIRRMSIRRRHPKILFRQMMQTFKQYTRLYNQLPEQFGHIIDKLEHGELAIRFKHEKLPDVLRSLEHVSNRLTSGVIIGALIIGSSLIITTGVKPHLFGYPAFGIIGYLISAIMGLWLVFDILRNR